MLTRRRAQWWLLPLIATILFAGLVAFDVNGSSLSLLGGGSSAGKTSGVIAGTPRPIRSDEWVVTTPLSIQAAKTGFPTDPYVGITETDVAIVVNTGPSTDWIEAFKAQDWGYFLLGASRGLAWHWWFSFLVCLVGAYCLILQLTRSVYLAVAGGFVITFSPYTAWWSAPSTALLLGFGSLAAFLLVRAFTASTSRRGFGWSIGAGYAAVCLVAVAYPPWILQTVYVVTALVIGIILDNWRGVRRVMIAIGPAAVVAGSMVGAWYFTNRESWAAFLGTEYPGNRLAASGTANGGIGFLQSAPWNFLVWRTDGQAFEGVNNSAAASSWIAIPLVLAGLVVGLLAWWRKRAEKSQTTLPSGELRYGIWTFGLIGAVFVLLLAWALVPGLGPIGNITLLERIHPQRTPLGLGLAAALILVLSVVVIIRTTVIRERRVYQTVLLGGAVATVILAIFTFNQLPLTNRTDRPLIVIGAITIFVLLCWLLYAKRTRPFAAVLLAGFCFFVWVGVNPLVKGLGPIPNDPLVLASERFLEKYPSARFIVEGSGETDALVRASGAESVSWTTYYPNWDTMRALFPGQEAIWNNFVNYNWVHDPSAQPATLVRVGTRADRATIQFNPCAPELKAILGVNAVMSQQPVAGSPCLQLESQVQRGNQTLYLYAINSGRAGA